MKTRGLIYFGNKINIMTFIYVLKLGFQVWKTNIRALKIDGSRL